MEPEYWTINASSPAGPLARNSSIAADDSDGSLEVACKARMLVGVPAKDVMAEIRSRKDRNRSLGVIGNLQAVSYWFEAQGGERSCLQREVNF